MYCTWWRSGGRAGVAPPPEFSFFSSLCLSSFVVSSRSAANVLPNAKGPWLVLTANVLSVSPSSSAFFYVCFFMLHPVCLHRKQLDDNGFIIFSVVGFNCNIQTIKLCNSTSVFFLFFVLFLFFGSSIMLILLSNVPQTKPLHAVSTMMTFVQWKTEL